MKATTIGKRPTEPKFRVSSRGFPIWVTDGKMIDEERQIEIYLGRMFELIERSRERVLQANVEVKILTKKK